MFANENIVIKIRKYRRIWIKDYNRKDKVIKGHWRNIVLKHFKKEQMDLDEWDKK